MIAIILVLRNSIILNLGAGKEKNPGSKSVNGTTKNEIGSVCT